MELQSEKMRPQSMKHSSSSAAVSNLTTQVLEIWRRQIVQNAGERMRPLLQENHIEAIVAHCIGMPIDLEELSAALCLSIGFHISTAFFEVSSLRSILIERLSEDRCDKEGERRMHRSLDQLLEQIVLWQQKRVAFDANEAKLAILSESLRRSEETLKRLIDSNIIGILTCDREGGIISANQAFLEIIHSPSSEFASRGDRLSDFIHKDSRDVHRQMLAELRMRGTSPPKELRLVNHLNEVTSVLIAAVDLKDHSGSTMSLIVDLSDRKRIEEELQASRRSAEEASRSKSLFLAHVSHEIRTPLGAILGFSELLRKGNLSQKERLNYVETISRNCRELAFLIDDILDLSKVEAGRLEIERMPLSLPKLLSDIAGSLSIKAHEKNIRLSIKAKKNVPQMIISDPNRLRQILLNIVGNAIKFTENGTVRIICKMVPADGRDKLLFIIKDEGIGISEKARAALFQPFAQGEAYHKFGGTGLGLVLSKRLAQALGGDVNLLASVPGQGSTFLVCIDMAAPHAAEGPGVARSGPSDKEDGELLSRDLLGTKVLLAEDSPDIRFLVERFLIEKGVDVTSVGNGGDAVRMALQNDYHLILMDMEMPVLDGYDATEELRRKGYRKPIIALTAHAMEEERRRSLRAGCNDHLTKPINKNRLLFTVAQYRGS